jgi:hypothetical protein
MTWKRRHRKVAEGCGLPGETLSSMAKLPRGGESLFVYMRDRRLGREEESEAANW